MPDLTLEQLTLALAVLAGVVLLAVLITLFLALRLRRIRKQYALVRGDGEQRDLLQTLSAWARELDGVRKRVDVLESELEKHKAVSRFSLQHFHMVRYDAFEEMGGRLSFSAALLDDHGDGIVVTSINGRTETRTYSKPVKGLASDYNLSEEERDAIQKAMAGRGRSSESDRRGPAEAVSN